MYLQGGKDISRLLSRKIAGTTPPEDDRFIAEWMSGSQENRIAYENLMSGRSFAKRQSLIAGLDIPVELAEVKRRVRRIVKRRRMRRSLSGAAAAIVITAGIFLIRKPAQQGVELALTPSGISQAVLTVGSSAPVSLNDNVDETAWEGYITGNPGTEPVKVKVEVPNSGEYKLRLSDGTLVWLNSETSIEYPAEFADGERRVHLRGEAYFEVERNEAMPFTVVTPQARITVLGTSFNVSAYEGERSTTATLVSGRVAICSDQDCIELSPDRQAVVMDGMAGITIRDVNAKSYMAWTSGLFEFENMRLEDICTRLSRWYDVSFRFEGATADERITGATWKYKPLGELLKGIELVAGVSFKYSGDFVTASYGK